MTICKLCLAIDQYGWKKGISRQLSVKISSVEIKNVSRLGFDARSQTEG
jgi:hypothetical protein